MRQYYSNNKNYKAILESMAQIRQNQLNEQYGYYAEQDDEEEMQEGVHGDEEEMEERYMYEGEQEDDEDAQMEALAEMMDEALMELDDEDDEDNQMLGEAEEDDERRARRRARLRNALLIGAGLVATGGLAGAAMMNPVAREMIGQGAGKVIGGAGDFAKGVGNAAFNMLPQTTRDQMSAGMEAGQEYVDSTIMPKAKRVTAAADLATQQALSKYGKPAREYASQLQTDLGVKAKDMKFLDTPQAQSFGDDRVRMGRYDYNDPTKFRNRQASVFQRPQFD